jgi:hypothetical protein
MPKRQHTKIVYRRVGRGGDSWIEIGLISRRRKPPPFDVISLRIKGVGGHQFVHNLSPDEAIEISSALAHSVDCWLCRFKPYRKFRRWPLKR